MANTRKEARTVAVVYIATHWLSTQTTISNRALVRHMSRRLSRCGYPYAELIHDLVVNGAIKCLVSPNNTRWYLPREAWDKMDMVDKQGMQWDLAQLDKRGRGIGRACLDVDGERMPLEDRYEFNRERKKPIKGEDVF